MDQREEAKNRKHAPTAEELELDRKIAEDLRREEEEYHELVRNHERHLEEIESRKGILERLFGIRTQVP
jgi:hypothetical protein